MGSNFLFDQFQPNPGLSKPMLNKGKNCHKLTKFIVSSENVDNKSSKMFGSSTSLPAIRNMSDYYESNASESSVFDGNDSAVASSLDLSLDANGQPIFDNISASGDNSAPIANDHSSEGVPLKPKKLKRQAIKKKSGFIKQDMKKASGSEYSSSDDDA